MAVVPLAFVGQGQLARTAGNQLAAQFGFQGAQYFADGGLGGLHFSGDCGKTAAFDHPNENRHCVEFVHELSDSCRKGMGTIAFQRLIGMSGQADHGLHPPMTRDRQHD